MPTIITHALVGASAATLRPAGISGLKLGLAMAVLAVLPDVDVVGFRYGIAYGDVLGHRGLTHSLSFAAVTGVLVTVVLFPSVRRFPLRFLAVAALLFAATASHGVLDAFTNSGHGVGFFLPFDETRYFFPWRPLETSPLSVERFLNASGARILLNEMQWVWLPTALMITLVVGLRVRLKR